MLRIRQNLCPPGRYDIKCPYTRTPSRIVIHNTANDAPAGNEISYMLNRPEKVSFHYAVDDEEAVQGLPLDRSAFASGDGGRGTGNLYGIHIEICYSLSGGSRFAKAEANAAELTARLLKQYGWGIEKVTKHQDYDGKYCPHRTLDLGWQRFLKLVQDKLEEMDDMTREEVQKIVQEEIAAGVAAEIQKFLTALGQKPVSGWAQAAVDFCREQGVMVGDSEDVFRPQSFVTRQELALVAAKLLKGKG